MALIEHLERDGWEDFFRDIFRYTLDVLKNDRFRPVGSSVDDLRSWLTAGGVARARECLAEQMEMRRFAPSRRSAIDDCFEQLVRENRDALLHLTIEGVVPAPTPERLDARGASEQDIQDLVRRMLFGERPFEDWMHAHGHSDEEIAETCEMIDRWLMQEGIIPKPPPLPKPN